MLWRVDALPAHTGIMTTSPYAVSLASLEHTAHVPLTEQVEEQAEPRLHDAPVDFLPWPLGAGGAGAGGAGCDGGDC